jgi:oligopeptide/dipeptide ABC transporter ATP-binding protein
MISEPLLQVEGLRTVFDTSEGVARAVDGVSFEVAAGETVGIVGESGCGKSVTALSIMRLIQSPPGRIQDGHVVFSGRNLLELAPSEMRAIRGNDIAMIFQEPMTSLNPVLTVGYQICEALQLHRGLSKPDALEQAERMLEMVEMPDARERLSSYPHQLSGGMRQRVMIAMALSCEPRLLIADEPTTALDVTIEAQILRLLRALRDRTDMAMILITHDLGVVATCAERIVVMYAGKVVEQGPVERVFRDPIHPYTRGLLNSLPKMGPRTRLEPIPGMVPRLTDLPSGCRFRDRCPLAEPRCASTEPDLEELAPAQRVACIVEAGRRGGRR